MPRSVKSPGHLPDLPEQEEEHDDPMQSSFHSLLSREAEAKSTRSRSGPRQPRHKSRHRPRLNRAGTDTAISPSTSSYSSVDPAYSPYNPPPGMTQFEETQTFGHGREGPADMAAYGEEGRSEAQHTPGSPGDGVHVQYAYSPISDTTFTSDLSPRSPRSGGGFLMLNSLQYLERRSGGSSGNVRGEEDPPRAPTIQRSRTAPGGPQLLGLPVNPRVLRKMSDVSLSEDQLPSMGGSHRDAVDTAPLTGSSSVYSQWSGWGPGPVAPHDARWGMAMRSGNSDGGRVRGGGDARVGTRLSVNTHVQPTHLASTQTPTPVTGGTVVQISSPLGTDNLTAQNHEGADAEQGSGSRRGSFLSRFKPWKNTNTSGGGSASASASGSRTPSPEMLMKLPPGARMRPPVLSITDDERSSGGKLQKRAHKGPPKYNHPDLPDDFSLTDSVEQLSLSKSRQNLTISSPILVSPSEWVNEPMESESSYFTPGSQEETKSNPDAEPFATVLGNRVNDVVGGQYMHDLGEEYGRRARHAIMTRAEERQRRVHPEPGVVSPLALASASQSVTVTRTATPWQGTESRSRDSRRLSSSVSPARPPRPSEPLFETTDTTPVPGSSNASGSGVKSYPEAEPAFVRQHRRGKAVSGGGRGNGNGSGGARFGPGSGSSLTITVPPMPNSSSTFSGETISGSVVPPSPFDFNPTFVFGSPGSYKPLSPNPDVLIEAGLKTSYGLGSFPRDVIGGPADEELGREEDSQEGEDEDEGYYPADWTMMESASGHVGGYYGTFGQQVDIGTQEYRQEENDIDEGGIKTPIAYWPRDSMASIPEGEIGRSSVRIEILGGDSDGFDGELGSASESAGQRRIGPGQEQVYEDTPNSSDQDNEGRITVRPVSFVSDAETDITYMTDLEPGPEAGPEAHDRWAGRPETPMSTGTSGTQFSQLTAIRNDSMEYIEAIAPQEQSATTSMTRPMQADRGRGEVWSEPTLDDIPDADELFADEERGEGQSWYDDTD